MYPPSSPSSALRSLLVLLALVGTLTGCSQEAPPPLEVVAQPPVVPEKPAPTEAPKPVAKRYAVLIGINTYQSDKLTPVKYAVSDMTDLAEALRAADYNVTLLTSPAEGADSASAPTRATILETLEKALGSCKKEDVALVAFSGHGLFRSEDQKCYLCPADAGPAQAETLLSLDSVQRLLDKSGAGARALLLDACRDNPALGAKYRGLDSDIVPHPAGTLGILVSCSAGQHSYEHEPFKHGLFFHYVIDGIKGAAKDEDAGYVTLDTLTVHVCRQMFRQVPALVGNGAKQWPDLVANLGDDPLELVPGAEAADKLPANPTLLQSARESLRTHSHRDAAKEYLLHLGQHPDDREARTEYALTQVVLLNFPSALMECDRLIKADPKNVLAYAVRGWAKRKLHDPTAGLADCDKALKLNPQSGLALSVRGMCYADLNRPTEALADSRAAVMISDDPALARVHRGYVFAKLKQSDRAIDCYSAAIRLDANLVPAYNDRAVIYNKRKEYDKAIDDLSTALDLDVEDPSLHVNLGVAFVGLEQFDEALTEYNAAINKSNGYAPAYAARGALYALQKEYVLALSDLDTALRGDPKNADAYANRGAVYAAQKQYDRAILDYNAAIGINPKFARAYSNRAIAYRAKGDLKKADADAAQAQKLQD